MRHGSADRTQPNDQHLRAGDQAITLGADRVLCPLALGLTPERVGQSPEERERDRQDVFGDGARPTSRASS